MGKKIEETTDGLDTFTRAELDEAIADGYEVLESLTLAEDPTDDDVQAAVKIRELLDAAEARVGEMDAESNARKDELAKIRERVEARKAEKAEAEGAKEPDEPQNPETDGVTEPVVETAPVVEETAPVVEGMAPEALAASAASAREALAGRRPAPPAKQQAPEKPVVAITAAADAGVFPSGTKLTTLDDVMKIAQHRWSTMRGTSGRLSLGVAQFEVPAPADVTINQGMTDQQVDQIIGHAGDESRLVKPLTAAGWCAPSETVYDLCEGSTTEGLFDLPEVRINRGGINYTEGPDFSALYSADNVLTEAEVIAGTDKVCLEVPCPEFDEVRLDAIYMCVTSSLLTKVGYPELEAGFLREAMIAHQHRVSSYSLNKVVAAAGTALEAGALGSIASGALAAVELVAEGQRSRRRWSMTQTIEAVVPSWFRGALRADLSNRTGVDLLKVSDSDIAAYFAVRGIRIQYIYGWQALPDDAVLYPETVDILMYKAGTFVRGTAPVISLNAVYDSALLKENKHIALFFEEGALVLGRCNEAQIVTVPVCAAGRTGSANITECLVEVAGP